MQLGGRVSAGVDIRKIALPLMEKLRDRLTVSPNQVIGSRAPLHVTAVGKLMMGAQGEAACRSYAKRSKLPPYTTHTHTRVTTLLHDCITAAKRGYALDNEEAELGVGCIGTLIHDANGHVAAGLSVSAPIERRRDEWIEQVMETGLQISRQLGYHSA